MSVTIESAKYQCGCIQIGDFVSDMCPHHNKPWVVHNGDTGPTVDDVIHAIGKRLWLDTTKFD